MLQRKYLIDRLFRTWSTFHGRVSETDCRCNQRTLYVAASNLRTPRRRFCPYTSVAGTEKRVRREGTVRGTEGLTRFALPECRGRVFGRDTKVRAPRIPWLRLPGWANICVSRRRDFAAKSRARPPRDLARQNWHSRSANNNLPGL